MQINLIYLYVRACFNLIWLDLKSFFDQARCFIKVSCLLINTMLKVMSYNNIYTLIQI